LSAANPAGIDLASAHNQDFHPARIANRGCPTNA